jgi:tellurite resistance protein
MSHDSLLDDLISVARRDGVVTDDERKLIDSVHGALAAFALERARSLIPAMPGRRTPAADLASFQRRRQARQRVVEAAVERAWQDGSVSHDERQILLALLERLPRLGRAVAA